MVAFQEAPVAISWALDVQEALMRVHWPADILKEESCTEVLREDANENCKGEGSEKYLFRGLRVRIGIHTGMPELEYNPRTNGVDYFGPVVRRFVLILLGSRGLGRMAANHVFLSFRVVFFGFFCRGRLSHVFRCLYRVKEVIVWRCPFTLLAVCQEPVDTQCLRQRSGTEGILNKTGNAFSAMGNPNRGS